MLVAVAPAVHDDCEITELLYAGKREAAFSVLQRRYADRIYRLCCVLLRQPDLAEDAAQESLLRDGR